MVWQRRIARAFYLEVRECGVVARQKEEEKRSSASNTRRPNASRKNASRNGCQEETQRERCSRRSRNGRRPTARRNAHPTGARRKRRATAESMAASQRDISVSEFFAKNRHLLGFDNPRKALLTTVKEAVDNSLDACEEAGIVPEIWVTSSKLEPTATRSAFKTTGRASSRNKSR